MPSTDVEAYIRAPQTVERLLDALFPGEDLGRPDADAIRQTCPKVFCILLCNDHGHLINHLIQHQYLSDRRLPFTESDLASAIDDQDICSSFIKRQGEFCASEFQNRSFAVLDKRHSVLPIIQVEKLGDGGSAVIHKITLHEAYDQLQFGTHRRRPIENVISQASYYTSLLLTLTTDRPNTWAHLCLKNILSDKRRLYILPKRSQRFQETSSLLEYC